MSGSVQTQEHFILYKVRNIFLTSRFVRQFSSALYGEDVRGKDA